MLRFKNISLLVVPSLVMMICTSISGCSEANNREPVLVANAEAGSKDLRREIISADYILSDEDLSAFQKGRLKEDILADVHWCGNLDMATLYDGKAISGIGYGVFGGPFSDDPRGKYVWAIFIDDKFEKFIVPDFDTKKRKFGDFNNLIRAVAAESISFEKMQKAGDGDPATKSQTDYGLTAASLVIGAGARTRHERDLKRNVELRSQFNALELEIGMDERTVEETLDATPLMTGDTANGTFRIYGSEESLDAISPLHHAIIVTLFSSGKLTGIYSGACTVDGNDLWRQKLCEIYSNVCP